MRCPALINLPLSPPTKAGWPWTQENPGLPEATPDGRPWPTISIVTPNYNYGQFIEETIRSVLLQGYPALEYIIIDGGSSDGSIDIIRKYERWLAFWTSEKDQGQSSAINKGFSKATGEIFAWLNSDDLLLPGAFHRVATYWLNNPSCNFLAGDGELVDVTGEKLVYYMKGDHFDFRLLLEFYKKTLPQPSVFFSKQAFKETGGLDAGLTYAMDHDLWLRIIEKYAICYVPACLSRLRRHPGAKTFRDRHTHITKTRDVVMKHFYKINAMERFYISSRIRLYHAVDACRSFLCRLYR